ncbi:MAG: NAD(P)H-dependent oxidoreductase [Alphaproteobacteria bacterium]|nr:NAD(P)H-dependent oxidoreductase [Alphaproteobacteria bacterium]
MKVLWVFAHPEPRSLSGSLRDAALAALTGAGHEVKQSDLHAMKWKAVADTEDFPARDPAERLYYMAASQEAYQGGTQSRDVATEQDKLLWADTVILQFPFWWFSMPAILKGWIDRVFAKGFAYGLPDPKVPGWSRRYGDGVLTGRRSMLVITMSAQPPAMGPRGLGGNIDDLLFPIHHGTLWYSGMTVLPPFIVNGTGRMTPDLYAQAERALTERLLTLDRIKPIPFRTQSGGDYDSAYCLKPGLEGEAHGLAIHLRRDG